MTLPKRTMYELQPCIDYHVLSFVDKSFSFKKDKTRLHIL